MSENKIKVSICVISFNQEAYIQECLASLVSQITDFPFEIVIRDDASQDRTHALILEFQKKYPDVIVVLDGSKNLGMNKNLLEVFKRARGDYIALCEGDDYWVNDTKIQKQYEALEAWQHSDICCHPAWITQKTYLGKHKAKGSKTNKNLNLPVNEIIQNDGAYIATSSIMIRKSIVSKLPDWFKDAPIGDYFIQVCGALQGGCVYLPEAMSVYRKFADKSWSKEMLDKQKKKIFLEKYLHYLQLFSEFIGCEYRYEFDKIQSRTFCSMAMESLFLDLKEDFNRYICKSWMLFPGLSLKHKLVYYVRFAPKLLRYSFFLHCKLKTICFRKPVSKKVKGLA